MRRPYPRAGRTSAAGIDVLVLVEGETLDFAFDSNPDGVPTPSVSWCVQVWSSQRFDETQFAEPWVYQGPATLDGSPGEIRCLVQPVVPFVDEPGEDGHHKYGAFMIDAEFTFAP